MMYHLSLPLCSSLQSCQALQTPYPGLSTGFISPPLGSTRAPCAATRVYVVRIFRKYAQDAACATVKGVCRGGIRLVKYTSIGYNIKVLHKIKNNENGKQYILVLLGLKKMIWTLEDLNVDWFIIRKYWRIFGGFLLVQLPDFALFWCHICKARTYTANKYKGHKKPPQEYWYFACSLEANYRMFARAHGKVSAYFLK